MMIFADNLVDVAGGLLFGSIALVVLARVDSVAAIVAVVPLVVVALINQVLSAQLKSARRLARQSAAEVSGFLAAVTGASLTVKVAGAQQPLLAQLSLLNARRGRRSVRDEVLGDAAFTVNDAVIDLCMGLALLVIVLRSRAGELDAGEVALFAAYFANLAWLPRRIGWAMVGKRRFEVAAARLDELLPPPGPGPDPLTVHRPLPLLGGPPAVLPVPLPRLRLERLELDRLTLADRGVRDVSLALTRNSLTVVTGPVGSGKSSLLRAILGLLPLDSGTVRWNGEEITDRAAFFVPPQCAYVPQVPRLFADSLRDNLLLGLAAGVDELLVAVHLAAFERDVAGFPAGLETPIGSRGVRLSGGQAQRAAAARALVRRPELLVLDDLTSVLDVETELALWDRLAAEGFTVLAASNRRRG